MFEVPEFVKEEAKILGGQAKASLDRFRKRLAEPYPKPAAQGPTVTVKTPRPMALTIDVEVALKRAKLALEGGNAVDGLLALHAINDVLERLGAND